MLKSRQTCQKQRTAERILTGLEETAGQDVQLVAQIEWLDFDDCNVKKDAPCRPNFSMFMLRMHVNLNDLLGVAVPHTRIAKSGTPFEDDVLAVDVAQVVIIASGHPESKQTQILIEIVLEAVTCRDHHATVQDALLFGK